MAQTFTTDLVMRAINSYRNSKAFGQDKLSIFHLKHLGPRAIEYITNLFDMSDCGNMEVVIDHTKTWQGDLLGTLYRPISFLFPAAKVLESLIFFNGRICFIKENATKKTYQNMNEYKVKYP